MSFLKVDDIHLILGDFIMKGVSFEIEKGDYLAIIGPTGAGKTILLESIVGFYPPEQGTIYLEGKDITRVKPYKRNIGIVYQDYALMPHMTVFDNIAYGAKKKISDPEIMKVKLKQIAASLKIDHLLHRRPGKLSGGEKQRTALARALIAEPRLLLLDEPLSSLDPQMRKETRRLIRTEIQKRKITVIHITHDLTDAWALASKVAVFKKGKIIQFGTMDTVFNRPENRFTADMVGVKLFSGRVKETIAGMTCIDVGGLLLYSSDLAELGESVRVAVRPENIMIAPKKPEAISARNIIKSTLDRIETTAGLQLLSLSANGIAFKILITRNALEEMALNPGDTVYALIKCTHVKIV